MKSYLQPAVAILLFLFAVLPAIAQNDSVAPGVMKVRRAPVPTTYYVELTYNYSSPKQNFFQHLFNRHNDGPKPIDGEFYPPQPVSFPDRPDDSIHALQDSSYLMQFFEKEDRPAGDYPWVKWLDQYEHYILWTDTAGIDSCVFVYQVNTRGRVQVIPGADDQKDSSATAMQAALWPYMRKLWLWYPAIQMPADGKGKQRKVNCMVTVKIYAIRDDQQKKMPLKIVN